MRLELAQPDALVRRRAKLAASIDGAALFFAGAARPYIGSAPRGGEGATPEFTT